MKVSEAVVEILAREEVPFVAGIPGGGVVDYLDAIYGRPKPRFILVRHEQVAVHMALGYAELTGLPAAVLASRSPGASNCVIGIQAAFVEGSPLVLITSHVNSKVRGLSAFQEIDLEAVFKPITKLSVEVRAPERVAETLEEAFRVARAGRPGPVHVSIPLDFPKQDIDIAFAPPSRDVLGALAPQPRAVNDAAELLANARRPVIIAGGGVTKARAASSVMELAELLGAAVTNTWEKKVVPEDHSLATGGIGRGGSGASSAVLHEADVILAIGTRFSEFATEDYHLRFTAEQRLIQVDVDAATVGRVYPVEVGICADASAALGALNTAVKQRIGGRPKSDWPARIAKLRQDWQQQISQVAWDAEPILTPRVVRDLKAAVDLDAVICTDSGNFNYWLTRYFPASVPGAFLYPAATGPMGCGLPAAMGVKAAFPQRQVVAVAGDGGFAMTMQDLETCVREHINVVAVVINNSGFGNIKIRQQTVYENRLIGCEFENPDFAEVARLCGAYGETVKEPGELQGALARALGAGQPAVVDIHVDPEETCTATVEAWW